MSFAGGSIIKGKRTAYSLWAVYLLTVVIIILSIFQIKEINEEDQSPDNEGWDFEAMHDSFATIAIMVFGIIVPIVLSLLLLPLFISSIGWLKRNERKIPSRLLLYGIVIGCLFMADMALLAIGNFSDGYTVQAMGAVAMMASLLAYIAMSFQFRKGSKELK